MAKHIIKLMLHSTVFISKPPVIMLLILYSSSFFLWVEGMITLS